MDVPGPRGHEKTLTYPAVCDPESCDCEALGFRKEGTHIIGSLKRPAGTYTYGNGALAYTPTAPEADVEPDGATR